VTVTYRGYGTRVPITRRDCGIQVTAQLVRSLIIEGNLSLSHALRVRR